MKEAEEKGMKLDEEEEKEMKLDGVPKEDEEKGMKLDDVLKEDEEKGMKLDGVLKEDEEEESKTWMQHTRAHILASHNLKTKSRVNLLSLPSDAHFKSKRDKLVDWFYHNKEQWTFQKRTIQNIERTYFIIEDCFSYKGRTYIWQQIYFKRSGIQIYSLYLEPKFPWIDFFLVLMTVAVLAMGYLFHF